MIYSLNEDSNIFDIEGAKRQKARLLQLMNVQVRLLCYMHDGDGIKHEFTDKMPITNFPLKEYRS